MKDTIPVHHHQELSDNGIHMRIVTPDPVNSHPVEYAHRDDYYIFGIIVKGKLNCDIDFNRQTISEGDLQFIRPGQVHGFVSGEDFKGLMLMAESGLVMDRYKLIFDEACINCSSVKINDAEFSELKTLFIFMYELSGRGVELSIIRDLVSAFIGLVAACFKRINRQKPDYNSRYSEIFLRFNSLLESNLAASHSPSFYADKLHLSPVYLNEVVKNVSGWSVSNYIRNEIVLHAKRMLCHTNMNVKEIAMTLGFEDNAYFTRMFTKASGKSPSNFRKNLE